MCTKAATSHPYGNLWKCVAFTKLVQPSLKFVQRFAPAEWKLIRRFHEIFKEKKQSAAGTDGWKVRWSGQAAKYG